MKLGQWPPVFSVSEKEIQFETSLSVWPHHYPGLLEEIRICFRFSVPCLKGISGVGWCFYISVAICLLPKSVFVSDQEVAKNSSNCLRCRGLGVRQEPPGAFTNFSVSSHLIFLIPSLAFSETPMQQWFWFVETN